MYADNRVCCQRSGLYRLCNSLLNSREIVLRNSAADNGFIEYIRCIVILCGSKANLYMSVLTVSACLLLILVFHI